MTGGLFKHKQSEVAYESYYCEGNDDETNPALKIEHVISGSQTCGL
jgi:hypothetical protein